MFKNYIKIGENVFIDKFKPEMAVINSVVIDDVTKVQDSKTLVKNDVYTKKEATCNATIELLLINPCTQKDVDKYTKKDFTITNETYDYYKQNILPIAISSNKQWIYSILNGESEQERIIYENDKFVLIPDMTWNKNDMEKIHIIAILKREDLYSIREIDNSNIDEIEEINKMSKHQISQKYNIKLENIRSYFHYHPTFWHLHIHFDTYNQNINANRYKNVDEIIQNVSMCGTYYQQTVISVYNPAICLP